MGHWNPKEEYANVEASTNHLLLGYWSQKKAVLTFCTRQNAQCICNEVDIYGKKEAGTGEHLRHFNNKINKHKWKAAAPHGRLPHTKHKLKFQAWSSLVFHCCHSSFNPSEAPPWDSRPVSGAGVVHYQLLHRPRSIPTALGPAPLVTTYISANSRFLTRVPWGSRIAMVQTGPL